LLDLRSQNPNPIPLASLAHRHQELPHLPQINFQAPPNAQRLQSDPQFQSGVFRLSTREIVEILTGTRWGDCQHEDGEIS
jgi:hypothetical protein